MAATVGLAILALAGCGGAAKQKAETSCPTSGKQVTFPLLDRSKSYTVDVLTNFGRFDIRLDVQDSPCTTSSFAALVGKRFFDGTRFHRIVPGFVIQGGDPNSRDENPFNDGQGGPGYTVPAEIKRKHEKGAVAMARMPDVVNPRRESNGSQFYICETPQPQLDSAYTIFAECAPVSVVTSITHVPRDANDKPLTPVHMKTVKVTRCTLPQ